MFGIVIARIQYLSVNKHYEKVYFKGSSIVDTGICYPPKLLGRVQGKTPQRLPSRP